MAARSRSGPRVFGAFLGTETNSFSGVPTTLEDFHQFGFSLRGTPIDPSRMLDSLIAPAKRFFEDQGGTFALGLRVFAQPGAPTDEDAYRWLKTQLIEDVEAAQPVDIVFLGLHGAMMTPSEPDCEGDLLAALRRRLGPDAVIGAFLDPHAHLTDRMCASADILVFAKEYPHTDFEARAMDVARLCWRTWRREISPVRTVLDLSLIRMWPTQHQPMRGFVEGMCSLEQSGKALSVSLVHGFPWGDSADVGSKVLVLTDGDASTGARIALDLGEELWSLRRSVDLEFMDVDAAFDRAAAAPTGPVVLADMADNPGGGAAQDSTFILARALARGERGVAIAAVHDPQAVEACRAAGEGVTVRLSVGGKHGRTSGAPVEADWRVMRLCDRLLQGSLTGSVSSLGAAAWVQYDGVDLVLCSERNQIFSPEAFSNIGIDPGARRILVVKSSNHFYAGFRELASAVFHVTTPGTLDMDLANLPYTRLQRPLWPRDPGLEGPQAPPVSW